STNAVNTCVKNTFSDNNCNVNSKLSGQNLTSSDSQITSNNDSHVNIQGYTPKLSFRNDTHTTTGSDESGITKGFSLADIVNNVDFVLPVEILENMECEDQHCDKRNTLCDKHRLLKQSMTTYLKAIAAGTNNCVGAKAEVEHKFNIDNWNRYVEVINDTSVLKYLKYGFPVDYRANAPPLGSDKNHKSAEDFPEDVDAYVLTELEEGALLGPFIRPPFQHTVTSPLMTRDKRGSTKRRVILDLSFPEKYSVNDGIDKEIYMNNKCKLKLPGPCSLKELIADKGVVYLWSIDYRRGYRQMRGDPVDWPLTCFKWKNRYYLDLAIAFGLTHGARDMQAISTAFTNILAAEGINALAYIDDIVGFNATKEGASRDLNRAIQLLEELGLEESKEKRNTPNTNITWLGITFDSVSGIMSIPQAKIQEALLLAHEWLNKDTCSKRQLRSLLGKLLHVASCSSTLRLFLNRILDNYRATPEHTRVKLDNNFKEDIYWILKFLPQFNGIEMLKTNPIFDEELLVDACLTGIGGKLGNSWYKCELPTEIQEQKFNISELEMWNILIAVNVFKDQLRGKTIHIRSDNASSICILQSGRGKCNNMLKCARSIWWLAILHDIKFIVSHILGQNNDIADALSRAHLSGKNADKLEDLRRLHAAYYVEVKPEYFVLQDFKPYWEARNKEANIHSDQGRNKIIKQ
ncbi:MAG: hypothetical protein GY702_00265, partial [Desulfobulbaceae bacterium]|nr:hypothetical protein [Desulfobulbaceae bacterium]